MFELLLIFVPIVQAAPSKLVPPPELVPYAQQITLLGERADFSGELGSHCQFPSEMCNLRAVAEFTTDGTDPEDAARYTSAPILSDKPFRDLLVSWNVDCPEQIGFTVELRVGADANSPWSPWMFVGGWGKVPTVSRNVSCDKGRIDTDYFHGDRVFERAQVRMTAVSEPSSTSYKLVAVRLTCCASDPETRVPLVPILSSGSNPDWLDSPYSWKHRIQVPFRSQRSESPDIAGRICSPTSLGMMIAYRGVDLPTARVAERAYDADNKIYGNWPRNVQAAYSLGIPSYLTRFTNWTDVQRSISKEQPIIASIAAKEGELHGAPYKKTDGHLLVITGFDAKGDVCVNDPAAVDAKSGQTVYARADMQKVWLNRGGTAYVLLPKP